MSIFTLIHSDQAYHSHLSDENAEKALKKSGDRSYLIRFQRESYLLTYLSPTNGQLSNQKIVPQANKVFYLGHFFYMNL